MRYLILFFIAASVLFFGRAIAQTKSFSQISHNPCDEFKIGIITPSKSIDYKISIIETPKDIDRAMVYNPCSESVQGLAMLQMNTPQTATPQLPIGIPDGLNQGKVIVTPLLFPVPPGAPQAQETTTPFKVPPFVIKNKQNQQ